MNTHRTERITDIIQKRRPLAEKILGVEADLKSLDSALRHLEEHRNQLLTRVDEPHDSLQELDLAKIQLNINTELAAILKLKARFCRNTLNIGVVGRARQGKSRLIQSLTGLAAAENPDGDRLTFIDMPSFGDLGVGDEQRLIGTLTQDIDALLFVRMPKQSSDQWTHEDVYLYDTARTALVDLPINLWSFIILNRTEAHSDNCDNLKNCQNLARDIANKHINVVDCITANCAHPQEASKVIDRVLDYLEAKITDLDYKYAFLCRQRLVILQNQVNAELEKVSKALDRATQDIHGLALFEIKFKELWRDLTNGLEKLLKELRNKREKVDAEFKKQVEVALQMCRSKTGIPSIEEIEQRNDIEKGYGIVYEKYLIEIRAQISQHFLSLDYGLKRSLDKVKSQVAQVLIEQGHLGGLTEAREVEFIKAIALQIPDQLIPEKPSQLKLGFQILAEFELSYRGLVQHRIRQHLDGLTPNEPKTQKLSVSSAGQVLLNLKIAHAEAVYKCETALKNLLCEPSQAAFAIVEEFMDRIIRTPVAENEWRIFLQKVRSQIWHEFQQLGEPAQIQREWINSVEQATTANQLELMQLLN